MLSYSQQQINKSSYLCRNETDIVHTVIPVTSAASLPNSIWQRGELIREIGPVLINRSKQ